MNGATGKELASAKLHVKGSILLSLESTVSRMSGIAKVAQTIVDPGSLSLTLLGNLKSPGISTDMLREAVA